MRDYTGKRFLVTEDNMLIGEIIAELLTLCHATVSRAGSGEEALRMIGEAEEAFDAVLMDVQMPGMDGYEATQAIRARETKTHLPVFAMTASTQEGDRLRAFAAGMDAYLQKPLEMSAFDQALRVAWAS